MPKGEGRGTHDDATEQELEFSAAVAWWVSEVGASDIAIRWWVDNKISPEQP